MKSSEVRQKYLQFFKDKGHVVIPPARLVLEDDPTTLFTVAGMQPLVPYLLGAVHPEGARLVDAQPSFRAADIEEVGDNRHTTFFEMLGNWSLGDYFKAEQLAWVWQLLTQELKLDPSKLYVSVFQGQANLPKDEQSAEIWKKIGVPQDHIYAYADNWWSMSGSPDKMKTDEVGGPDSEVFYEFTQVEHDKKFGPNCHPNCDCGRFLEIGNSVFIQYQKQTDGSFKQLPQANVDFGGGLERLTAATENNPDVFQTDLYQPIINTIEQQTKLVYEDQKTSMRVIADHLKAATFLILSGVTPANKLHGYVLRRLIRRAAVKARQGSSLIDPVSLFQSVVESVLDIYDGLHGIDKAKVIDLVKNTVTEEVKKFSQTLDKGLREIQKLDHIDGKMAFDLYQTYGFPLELTEELVMQTGQKLDRAEFSKQFEKHKQLSRTASSGMFKGGLQTQGDQEVKYHTATHLLHQALRAVLGNHVIQRGSNITAERLRFDFSQPVKLTPTQLQQVEDLVNQQIERDLPVSFVTLTKDEALASGAIGAFGERYKDEVKVYSIGDFSKEICGGPHVEHTGVLGKFKIDKEESAGAGVRRIYATLS